MSRTSETPAPKSWGPVARLAQHARIARRFVSIGIVRKSQFRFDFVNQVVMDCFFYLTHILSFEFLYRHTDSIAGWNVEHVRVFLGFVFVSDAFSMVWFTQCWVFSDDLKNGNLDMVRVRPASPIFLYFYQRFSLEGLMNLAIAGGYLAYACAGAGLTATPGHVAQVLWALALAFVGRAAIVVLFSIVEFRFLNSDLSRFAHQFFAEINDRPLDVFHTYAKRALLYLVPIGAMSYVPASIVLGRISFASALVHTAFYVLFSVIVHRWWRASFRYYESAMS